MPRRARHATLAAVLALGVVAGCSGEEAQPAATDPGTVVATTGLPAATTAVPTTAPGTTSAPTTPAPATTSTTRPAGPGSPSTLPPLPGSDATAACAPLRDALPVAELRPVDSPSWPDERMRVVVDARRDSALYAQAAVVLPASTAPAARTLSTYTGWLADTVQGASGASAARSAIDAYIDRAGVTAAVGALDAWTTANCR